MNSAGGDANRLRVVAMDGLATSVVGVLREHPDAKAIVNTL